MPIRATRPYRGHADAGPKGVSWQVSNLHCGGQCPVACQLADPASRARGGVEPASGSFGKLLRVETVCPPPVSSEFIDPFIELASITVLSHITSLRALESAARKRHIRCAARDSNPQPSA